VTGNDSPETVKAGVKRVAIVGAESTGKTTLAQKLAQHFHTVWVPEYGREYTEVTVGRDAVFGYQWKTEEFVHIARRQLELEDQLAEQANRVLICDTDALATAIWHERYMGSTSSEVEEIAAGHNYDLYLLTAVDIPFVQDGIRDGEHLREWMTERFLQELEARHLPWLLLQGTYAERFSTAVTAIEKLMPHAEIALSEEQSS
jgi:HTH-type transcriptional regulator, transcriptional repressor of NAD biosynthesis genes